MAAACTAASVETPAEAQTSPAAAPAALLQVDACTRKASFDADLPSPWRGTNEAVRDLHRNLHQIEMESGTFTPTPITPQEKRDANRIQQSRTIDEWDVAQLVGSPE